MDIWSNVKTVNKCTKNKRHLIQSMKNDLDNFQTQRMKDAKKTLFEYIINYVRVPKFVAL